MTNKEKYGNEIIELAVSNLPLGLRGGKPTLCTKIRCEDCDFNEESTDECKGGACGFREWLNSEYVEPPVDWSKVPVDTPILVRDCEEEAWRKRHFAKYENGIVYAWNAGSTSWSVSASSNIVGWKFAKLAESEELK